MSVATMRLKTESTQRSAHQTARELKQPAINEQITSVSECRQEPALGHRTFGSALLSGSMIALAMNPGLQFPHWRWLALGAATLVALWGAWPFHHAALLSLRRASATTDTLISLGVIVSYGWSVFALLASKPSMHTGIELLVPQGLASSQIALETVTGLTTLLLIGRYLQVRSEQHLTSALEAFPEVKEGAQREKPTYPDTDVQHGAVLVQPLIDRVCEIFPLAVIAIAAAVFSFWLGIGGSTAAAASVAVAVLICACPCVLSLAMPNALLAGIVRSAQLGISVKKPESMASICRIDTIVVEKASVLNAGTVVLDAVISAEQDNDDEVLRYAAAVRNASEDPISQAIVRAAREKFDTAPQAQDLTSLTGSGATRVLEEQHVIVGDLQLFAERGLGVPDVLAAASAKTTAQGQTAVLVGWGGHARGVLSLTDSIDPNSLQAIAELKALKVRTLLMADSNVTVARALAERLTVDGGIANATPEGRVAAIRELQTGGKIVAMVGKEGSDTNALAQADVAIAMSTSSEPAAFAGGLTLVQADLRAAADAIGLSRRTFGAIKGNLLWALAYNLVVIPLAATGLVTPVTAAVAAVLSTVVVVTNSLRLLRFTSIREAA